MDSAFTAALCELHKMPNIMPMPWERGAATTTLGASGVMATRLELVLVRAPVPPEPQRALTAGASTVHKEI